MMQTKASNKPDITIPKKVSIYCKENQKNLGKTTTTKKKFNGSAPLSKCAENEVHATEKLLLSQLEEG